MKSCVRSILVRVARRVASVAVDFDTFSAKKPLELKLNRSKSCGGKMPPVPSHAVVRRSCRPSQDAAQRLTSRIGLLDRSSNKCRHESCALQHISSAWVTRILSIASEPSFHCDPRSRQSLRILLSSLFSSVASTKILTLNSFRNSS